MIAILNHMLGIMNSLILLNKYENVKPMMTHKCNSDDGNIQLNMSLQYSKEFTPARPRHYDEDDQFYFF